MATTLPEAQPFSSKLSKPSAQRLASQGTSRIGKFLLLVVLLGLLTAAVWGSGQYFNRLGGTRRISALPPHVVTRGDLLVTVTEDGNMESASNLEIKCQVAGGSSILWIIADGSTVKAGDKLVELDGSALDESINQQKIVYEKARSTKIQAEKNLEVAKLAVREYLEGTYKKALQDADALITISLENQRTAQNSLEHAERMFRKGYVSNLELEGQKFAVERSKLELDSARTAKDVLVNFTKVKMLKDLESQRDTAEALMKSETAAFELEELRLNRLDSQLKQCTIVAPKDGMVVYANNESRGRFGGQNEDRIQEGAAVRERQTILRLPDLSQMQVKVNVHESKVDQLRPGMRARMRILDRDLTGAITSIANQPESTGWMSANVKEYATIVRVQGQPEGLRPGMTSEVEMLVAHLKDVLTLPVAAVVEQRGEYACWIVNGEQTERRELVLGQSNDQFIEIKDGVSEGDLVIMNPRAVVAEARASLDIGKEPDVSTKFGDSVTPSPGAPQGASAPGANPAAGPGGAPTAGPPGTGTGPSAPGADQGEGRRGPGGPPEGQGGADGRGGPGEGGAGRGGGGRRGRMDLMQFDKDGDGKVSREEAPEQMSNFFDRLDGNADGSIDREEINAMRRNSGGGDGASRGGPREGGDSGPAGPSGAN